MTLIIPVLSYLPHIKEFLAVKALGMNALGMNVLGMILVNTIFSLILPIQ